ncbi:MAG: hypothetical protein IAE89_05395 [Anaerolineae bacterium]|nr:hypothetical protein [Anaerolineae bacterium]
MFPEDRVLIGVINRKRDLTAALQEHWYRIPLARFRGVLDYEYLAFYLSGAVRQDGGGIYYYAHIQGIELLRRRDMLPQELAHKRAAELYYRVALGQIGVKSPPILNPGRRAVTFLFTTWDRFCAARAIPDLYLTDARFVQRLPDQQR